MPPIARSTPARQLDEEQPLQPVRQGAARARPRSARTGARRTASRSRPHGGPASRAATGRATRRAARAATRPGRARAPAVAPVQPPGQRERGRGDDEVQRHEQVRVRRPDGHGYPRRRAGEHEHGEQPRPAERAARRSTAPIPPTTAAAGVDDMVAGGSEPRRERRQPAAHAARPAMRHGRDGPRISSARPSAPTTPPARASSVVTRRPPAPSRRARWR